MAILFQAKLETGDWSEFKRSPTIAYGQATVTATNPISSVYSALFTTQEVADWAEASIAAVFSAFGIPDQQACFAKLKLRLDTWQGPNLLLEGFIKFASERQLLSLGISGSDRHLRLVYWTTTGTFVIDSATTIPLGQPVEVIVYFKRGNGDGEIDVWLNGVEIPALHVANLINADPEWGNTVASAVFGASGVYNTVVSLTCDDFEITDVFVAWSVDVQPSSAQLQVGSSVTFAATPLGGVPPYTIRWIDNVTKAVLGTGAAFTFNATQAGNFQIYVEVTDSKATIATSIVIPITVTALPPVAHLLTVNSSPISAIPFTIERLS